MTYNTYEYEKENIEHTNTKPHTNIYDLKRNETGIYVLYFY